MVAAAVMEMRQRGISVFEALLHALKRAPIVAEALKIARELPQPDTLSARDQDVILAILAQARDRAARAGRDPDEGDILIMTISLAEAMGQELVGLPQTPLIEAALRHLRSGS